MALQYHETELLYTFLGKTLHTLHKRNQSKYIFLRLERRDQNSSNFLKQPTDFSLNFASLFGTMRYSSSVVFLAEILILSTKRVCQSTILVKFHLVSQKSEFLHFDGLQNHIKFQLKKDRRAICHDTGK